MNMYTVKLKLDPALVMQPLAHHHPILQLQIFVMAKTLDPLLFF